MFPLQMLSLAVFGANSRDSASDIFTQYLCHAADCLILVDFCFKDLDPPTSGPFSCEFVIITVSCLLTSVSRIWILPQVAHFLVNL